MISLVFRGNLFYPFLTEKARAPLRGPILKDKIEDLIVGIIKSFRLYHYIINNRAKGALKHTNETFTPD